MIDYAIRIAEFRNQEEISELLILLKAVFPKSEKFTAEYKTWQYLENPNGEVVAFNAYTPQGDLVAHYAAIPVRMVIGGREEKGLLSLDTATHPDHQGRGLFTKLANCAYEEAEARGYKFVIGVANGNSTHGFLKKLGFYLVSPLEFKVGIGDIYRDADLSGRNCFLYDSETLKWRLNCPVFDYCRNKNTILGSRPEPLFHTAVARVPGNLSVTALAKGHDVFNIYIGLGLEKKAGLYVNLPKFIKRSPFNLIFKDLTDGELPILTAADTFVQLLDFDVA